MTQITSIRNKRGINTTDLMDVKRIINKYSEQLYVHKNFFVSTNLINIDDMNQFFERHNLSNLHKKKLTVWIGLIAIKEIESIINTFQNRKHRAHMGSLVSSKF